MILPTPFKPNFFIKNRHIQTLFATFFRKPKKTKLHIENFYLKDGDFVETLWQKEGLESNKPIVILFHGLAGSIKSPYMRGIINALQSNGFASILMHFRGCGKEPNLLPRAYHSGDTADAKEFIIYLKEKYPSSPLYAVGFSIGGNMLLKLLGEWAESSLLDRAVSISAPMSLDISADTIEKGFAKIYQSYLLKPLNQTLLDKYKKFDMKSILGIDESRVKKIKTIREFDELYTAKIHGFKSSKDYYTRCSAKQFLKDIRVPTLIIHALDDPFMTPQILPTKDEISNFIILDISQYGGHVGFVGGELTKPKYWLEERILSFLIL